MRCLGVLSVGIGRHVRCFLYTWTNMPTTRLIYRSPELWSSRGTGFARIAQIFMEEIRFIFGLFVSVFNLVVFCIELFCIFGYPYDFFVGFCWFVLSFYLLPFCRFVDLFFCHFSFLLSFCRFVFLSFCCFVILLFCYLVVLLFCYYVVLFILYSL